MPFDRTQVKSKLAVLMSNIKLKLQSGELDKLTDTLLQLEPRAIEALFRLDLNSDANVAYAKRMLGPLIKRRNEATDLISRVVEGERAEDVVGELIIGVQTPPPPMTDKDRKKKKMGGGTEPESNKATYYPMEPGSQGWFET